MPIGRKRSVNWKRSWHVSVSIPATTGLRGFARRWRLAIFRRPTRYWRRSKTVRTRLSNEPQKQPTSEEKSLPLRSDGTRPLPTLTRLLALIRPITISTKPGYLHDVRHGTKARSIILNNYWKSLGTSMVRSRTKLPWRSTTSLTSISPPGGMMRRNRCTGRHWRSIERPLVKTIQTTPPVLTTSLAYFGLPDGMRKRNRCTGRHCRSADRPLAKSIQTTPPGSITSLTSLKPPGGMRKRNRCTGRHWRSAERPLAKTIQTTPPGSTTSLASLRPPGGMRKRNRCTGRH